MRFHFGLILIFSILITSVGYSNDAARSLYDQGKYQEALEVLQKEGLSTAADYYNAGNVYFRIGKQGQALAYYEKANALSPGSSDIRFNLQLTKESLEKAGSLPRDKSFWFGFFVPIARQIPEEFVDLLLAVVTVGLALVSLRLKRSGLPLQRALTHSSFLITLGLWALTGALTAATVMAHSAKMGAIVADLSVARSGPNETFTELFKLPAGTTVQLTGETREGWHQVRFSLGNVGWIGDKDLIAL